MCSCEGIREGNPALAGGKGFRNIVTRAIRTALPQDADEVVALGSLPGFGTDGGCSATLHAVGDEHVICSSRCTSWVKPDPADVCKSPVDAPVLSGPCSRYLQKTFIPGATKASSSDYNNKTPNVRLSTPQQARKLEDVAKEMRDMRKVKYQVKLEPCREDDIVLNSTEPQGRALFDALEHPRVKPVFNRIPEDSLAKAVLEENYEWNKRQGSSKGWRYNPKVLRWAVYTLARIGGSGYEILREVLQLPVASHVRKLRGAAGYDFKPKLQAQNIEAYGKIAAADDA
ncbi:unnamed protein product, partial [Ectocarpus sp. 13 AM-2016]